MKKINFAPGRKKKKQWTNKATLFFVIGIIGAVVFLQVRQWATLKRVKKEKTEQEHLLAKITDISEKKIKLEQEQEQLTKRLNKLDRIQNTPHPYFSLFSQINKLLKGAGQLDTLNLSKKNINLAVQCPDIKQATRFMHNLLALPSVQDIKLVSILPKENQFLVKMDGKLS